MTACELQLTRVIVDGVAILRPTSKAHSKLVNLATYFVHTFGGSEGAEVAKALEEG